MDEIVQFFGAFRRHVGTRSRRLMLAPGSMLLFLTLSPIADAQVLDAPYVSRSTSDTYSVSYLCPATVCYLEENYEYVPESEAYGPYGGGGAYYSAKPLGSYTYRVVAYEPFIGGIYYGPEVTVTVPIPPPPPPPGSTPKPMITLTSLYPVGPFGNPYYYNLGWTASFTNTNGCRLETSEQVMVDGWSTVLPGYVWTNLPATGSVQIGNRYPSVTFVFYELKCTGPGGTSKANGALSF